MNPHHPPTDDWLDLGLSDSDPGVYLQAMEARMAQLPPAEREAFKASCTARAEARIAELEARKAEAVKKRDVAAGAIRNLDKIERFYQQHETATPAAALEMHEGLVGYFQSLGNQNPEAKHSTDQFELALRQASVVLWDRNIWMASQRGKEAFANPSVVSPVNTAPQLWLFRGAYEAEDSRELLEAFEGYGDEAPRSLIGFLIINCTVLAGWRQGIAAFLVGFQKRNFGIRAYPYDPLLRNETYTPSDDLPRPPCPHILAGLRFMEMEFVGRERQTLPRHIRRAAELKRRPTLPEINVVQIRRTYRDARPGGGANDAGREWSCSWLVSGHWRNQWYPSKAGWAPKYIMPYAKGDPDKPLRAPKGTVYVVNR